MDAVAEEVPGAAEHDHLHGAALGVPVGSQQAAALTGVHGPAGERELQVTHITGLAVADLPVGAPARRRGQRSRDFWHAIQASAQRQGGRQLEGPRAAGRRTPAQLRDPDRPVGGRPADRAVAAGQDRPRLAPQVIFRVPADQVVLGAADYVQHARAGVGRAQLGQHRGSGLGLPVDRPVGLPAGRTALSPHAGTAVVQRLRPVPAASKPGHRQEHRLERGVGDFGAVHGTLRAAGHRELRAGPDVARVHLRVGLQHGNTPAPGTAHDRPVQRGRAAVTLGPGVNDKAGPRRPDVRRDRRSQHRRDDKVRVKAPDPFPHFLVPERQLDRHLVTAVGELGMRPLRHAVVGAGNKQDPHQRFPLSQDIPPAAAAHRSDFRSVSAVWAFVVGGCRTCGGRSVSRLTRFVSACRHRPSELAESSKWRRRLQRATRRRDESDNRLKAGRLV